MSKKENQIPHELVPPHKILSDAEKKKLLEKFGISEALLPKIHAADPAISSLSPKIGDIVQISRKDAAGQYEYYRLVVKG